MPASATVEDATHLAYREKTNLGSFYTPLTIVRRVYDMLLRDAGSAAADVVLETSCGYGAFFAVPSLQKHARLAGADLDTAALAVARRNFPGVEFVEANALANISREKYGVTVEERLIIVGNPPYNDITSHAKNRVKAAPCEIDAAVRTRDLGLSFLLSFEKLSPDFIAVLHPLSYLIKEANFRALRPLMRRYALRDALVFSSQEFSETSKGCGFPIVIALYARDERGTAYADIVRRRFRTVEGAEFSLSDFDYVCRYIPKYPSRIPESLPLFNEEQNPLRFFTMRDINALKRSRTFINEDTANTIYIIPEKLPYYCYVDAFKDIAPLLPYYLGNFDVPFDCAGFNKIKNDFVALSILKHPEVFQNATVQSTRTVSNHTESNRFDIQAARARVQIYFNKLLAPHCHVYTNKN
jgi:predicted RNA methylase